MDAEVFKYIGLGLEKATGAYLTPAVTRLIEALEPVALAGVALYITVMGYMVIIGAVESTFYTFLKQCTKVLLVTAFALHADTYLEWVVGTMRGLEGGLASALSVNEGAQAASVYSVLDHSLGTGLELVGTCFKYAQSAGYMSPGSAITWAFSGLIVAIAAVVITVVAGGNIIVAKVAIIVLFAIGPLFVLSLIWPVTARFFDSWFGQVLHFSLVSVLMAAFLSLAMRVFQGFIATANFDDTAINPIVASLQIAIVGAVLGYLMYQGSGMAAGLAGGISVAALTLRHLSSAGSEVSHFVNPVSTRRDAQTGRQENASRAAHLLAGNTVLNPRYRQALLGQIGRNWGRAQGGAVKKD